MYEKQTTVNIQPYSINTEALLSQVLSKHPFGVSGAIKEHFDNAIDADSTEIHFNYDEKERIVSIANISEKCYNTEDIKQLFHRRHHGKISQNDYGRLILFGFTDPKAIYIETVNYKDNIETVYELTPNGYAQLESKPVTKQSKYTTVVSAKLADDIDFNVDEFKVFINTVFNMHLWKGTIKITINNEELRYVLPKGEPTVKTFKFANSEFTGYMWKKPQWERKIYQSMNTKGVGDGVYICARNTLVTYNTFHRSHAGDEQSYFCLINDDEGYFAEDSLDLGKLQLVVSGKVSRFYRYIKDNYLPKETRKPSDVITEGNMYLRDFFSVGIGSYSPSTQHATGETKENKEPEHKDKVKDKSETSEKRTHGLPELTIRDINNYQTVPFIDIITPKLLAINTVDPLFEKTWVREKMREVFLIRLVPYLDARKTFTNEDLSSAREEFLIQDVFMRKFTKAKPKRDATEPIVKRQRGRPKKAAKSEETKQEQGSQKRTVQRKPYKVKPKHQVSKEVGEAQKELQKYELYGKDESQLKEGDVLKQWNIMSRPTKEGKQVITTLGMVFENGKPVRKVINKETVNIKDKDAVKTTA